MLSGVATGLGAVVSGVLGAVGIFTSAALNPFPVEVVSAADEDKHPGFTDSPELIPVPKGPGECPVELFHKITAQQDAVRTAANGPVQPPMTPAGRQMPNEEYIARMKAAQEAIRNASVTTSSGPPPMTSSGSPPATSPASKTGGPPPLVKPSVSAVRVPPKPTVETSVASSDDTNGQNSPSSALRESIEKKGDTSYYFAHAKTPTKENINKGGDPVKLDNDSSTREKAEQSLVTIRKYAFSDGKASVTVYIDILALGIEPSAEITHRVEYTPTSVRVVVNSTHAFSVPKLKFAIGSARTKLNSSSERLSVIMKKSDPAQKWPALS